MLTALGQAHYPHHTIAPAAMQIGTMHLRWTGTEGSVLLVTMLIVFVLVIRAVVKAVR